MNILNQVEEIDEFEEVEYSDETIEMIIDELEQELNDEISSIYESEEPSPVYIEDEFTEDISIEETTEEPSFVR